MKRIFTLVLIAFAFNTMLSQPLVFDDIPTWFEKQRAKPLVDFGAFDQTINISSYTNVIPNDGINDFAGINQAITDAITATAGGTKKVRLVFNVPGVYHVGSTIPKGTDFRQSFWIEAAKNLEIDGQGSELIIQERYRGAFYIRNSENVIIKNFKIDYDSNPSVFPFTQGRITAVGPGNTFSMVVPTGYPSPSQATAGTTQNWGVLKDGIGDGRLKANTYDLYPNGSFTSAGPVAGGTLYNCTATNESFAQQMDVGDWLIVQGRQNHTAVLYPSLSKQITFLNIDIYAGPAGGFHGSNNHEINIIRCRIIPRPGTDRAHSINADGVHIPGSFIGPWVQECEFRGFLDDTFNMRHQNADFSTVSANQISIGSSITPTVGDSIVIFNYTSGKVLSGTKVTAVSGNTATLSGNHNSTGGTVKAYFASRASNSLIVRNNLFHGSRGWGMITSATQGEISGNTFANLSTGGIKLGNIPGWAADPEGLSASDILIENNQISNCGFSRSVMVGEDSGASIKVWLARRGTCGGTTCEEIPVDDQLVKNITIKNNNIQYNKIGMSLQSINCLTLENNTLTFTGQDIYQDQIIPLYVKNTTFCNGQPVQDISLYPSELRLTQIGKTHTLLPTIVPVDATTTLVWTSSNPEIASVDANGVVTAIKEGVANIIVSVPSTSLSATCQVTVAKATLSTPRIHFMFDEPQGALQVVNTGTDVDVFGVIKGGVITPGATDLERGQVLQTNTSGNTNHIILFDAAAAYSGPLGGEARTFSFWIKPNVFRSYNDMTFTGSGSGGYFVVEFDQFGKIRFYDGSVRSTTQESLVVGEWTHLTVIVPENGNYQDLKIYFNGELSQMTYSNPAYNPPINTNEMNFLIGASMDGYLSDWRYYDYALDDQEIQNVYAPKSVESITVTPTETYIKPNDIIQIDYTIYPEDAANRLVTWSSNNEAVATVDANGLVTALTEGDATITVSAVDGNISASTIVYVNASMISLTNLSVNPSTANIEVGNTIQLELLTEPFNATDKTVNWVSSDPLTATVDENGIVTAIQNGDVTITAHANSGNLTANANLTVITSATSVNVTPPALVLSTNESFQLTATVAPETATNTSVIWTSSSPTMFSVNENGLVQASAGATGTATITATTIDGNHTDTCEVLIGKKVTGVSVSPVMVALNLLQTSMLTATITPSDAAIQTVTWSSENNSIANVSPNGEVIGVGMGMTTVYATTNDGEFVSSCLVVVNNVAYNKPVETSTNFDANASKANLNDNNFNTNWGTWSTADGWAIIDLGADYDISQFALFPRDNNPYKYTVEVKPNIGTYTTIVDRSTNTTSAPVFTDNVTTTARYVRLRILNLIGGRFYINEFMVFGALKGTVTGISVSPESITIEPNQTLQLTATITPLNATNTTVIWSSSNNTIASVDPNGLVTIHNVSGNETVIITATTNNGFTDTSEITVSNSLNLSEVDDTLNKTIKVFPNPTKGTLNIVLNNKDLNSTVTVVDLSGRILLNKQLTDYKTTLDLNAFSDGIYMLYTKNGNKVTSVNKIIVSH